MAKTERTPLAGRIELLLRIFLSSPSGTKSLDCLQKKEPFELNHAAPCLSFLHSFHCSLKECSTCSTQQQAECKESTVFPCLTQGAQFTTEGQVRRERGRAREQSGEDSDRCGSEEEHTVLSCSALLLLPQVWCSSLPSAVPAVSSIPGWLRPWCWC